MAKFRFTSQNSAAYAAKAHEARKLATLARKQQLAQIREDVAIPRIEPAIQDAFRETMLERVRAQIRMIMARIDAELEKSVLDTRALRDLGDTLARFESMEQKLSMRAGPGSLKPTAKPAPRRSAVTVDDDPRPVEAPSEKPAAQIPQDEAPAPAAPIAPTSPAPAPAQAAPAESWEAYPPA